LKEYNCPSTLNIIVALNNSNTITQSYKNEKNNEAYSSQTLDTKDSQTQEKFLSKIKPSNNNNFSTEYKNQKLLQNGLTKNVDIFPNINSDKNLINSLMISKKNFTKDKIKPLKLDRNDEIEIKNKRNNTFNNYNDNQLKEYVLNTIFEKLDIDHDGYINYSDIDLKSKFNRR